MTDYERVRAILDAATPGPWHTYEYDSRIGHHTGVRAASGMDLSTSQDIEHARAIVVARNLAPELLAVAEAAQGVLYIGNVRPFREAAEDRLGAALDALHAKMKETLT